MHIIALEINKQYRYVSPFNISVG